MSAVSRFLGCFLWLKKNKSALLNHLLSAVMTTCKNKQLRGFAAFHRVVFLSLAAKS